MTSKSGVTEVDSLQGKEHDDQEEEVSTATKRSSLLIYLRDSRVYIRALAVLIMVISLSLILSAVVMFSKAKNKPGHPLDAIPQPPTGITVSPLVYEHLPRLHYLYNNFYALLRYVVFKIYEENC